MRPPVNWRRDGILAVAAYAALLATALLVVYIGGRIVAAALSSATSV